MSIYKFKKKKIIFWSSMFFILTIVSITLFIVYKASVGLFCVIGFLAFGYIFLVLLKATVITTDKSIKKTVFNKVQECNWDMIYSIYTFRTSGGNYSTVLSWAKEPQYRRSGIKWIFEKNPKSGTLAVTDHFENYVNLLKEIKEKAVNAKLDPTTEKIIVGDK